MRKKTRMVSWLVFSVIAFVGKVPAVVADPDQRILRVWQTEVDPKAVAVLRDMADQFERAHPGTRIELESVAWGALQSKLATALTGGNPPDISHLEPFMAASIHAKDLLVPLDDVYDALSSTDIYPVVRDLQKFGSKRYGIAYALGITFFAYRKDVASKLGLTLPKTWAEYIFFSRAMGHQDSVPNLLLPGGDPFFIDQLAVELLAANGGRLFGPNNRPLFTEKPFIEMLGFFRQIAQLAPSDWLSEKYVDQFRHFAAGQGMNVPVTYARAAMQIDRDARDGSNDPEHFGVMPQPIGPSGTASYATLDAEPWVIFKASRNVPLAKDFLKTFYRRDNYLRFCKTVPIHLTPIFMSMAESREYLDDPFIHKWKPWQDGLLAMLKRGRVLPILISDKSDLNRPFLMELSGSRILSNLIFAVAKDGQDPVTAAREAQGKAEALIEKLGYRRW